MKKLNKMACVVISLLLAISNFACSNNDSSSSQEENCAVTGNHSYRLVGLEYGQSEIEKCGTYICDNCNYEIQKSITTQDLGLPIVEFFGSIDGISKENKVKVGVKYTSEENSFECDATLKVQGASSAGYPKKNFTIQLFEKQTNYDKKFKVRMADKWGKESKYCLKANWIDFSHSRNIVSAKLYGQVSKSRNIADGFNRLVNGGAIDGFPVVIYLNGAFHGLYTWNIPKDSWLFKMDNDDLYQALVMADDWTASTGLSVPVSKDFVSSGWELEYCSTEDTEGTDWVVDSLNDMIDFLNNYRGEDFKEKLSTYINVERAIDCMLHTAVINGCDNVSKNILWATYDGTQWMPCVYDMDSTWGLFWDGNSYYQTTDFQFEVLKNANVLWRRLFEYYEKDITNRYFELRETVYSIENIEKEFSNFINQIPPFVYSCEYCKWEEIPSIDSSNYFQIVSFAIHRLKYLDMEFAKIKN